MFKFNLYTSVCREIPNEWVDISALMRDFPEVEFAVHYSRNHMKPKKGKVARPKFHVFFPIDEVNNAEEYSAMKEIILKIVPYFDSNAKRCRKVLLWHRISAG